MLENTSDQSTVVDSLLSKIELPKIVDLIVSKQTQYYTLWAVYTAVQFAAGNYGYGHTLSMVNGLAVLFGVWAFNLGHLNFLLRCADQLEKLRAVLIAALDNNNEKYQSALREAFRNMSEVGLSERARQGRYSRAYFFNRTTYVHLFIDLCASVALLIRIGNP